MYEAYFALLIAHTHHVHGLCRDELDVLPGQAVNNQIEYESHNMGIDEEEQMLENESGYELAYRGPTDHEICRLIFKSFEEREEIRQRRLVDERCKSAVLHFLKKLTSVPREVCIHPYLKLRNRSL